MALTILYFAWVREAVGYAEETVDPPAEVRTVADMIGWLAGRSASHAAALGAPERLRAALDQAFVGPEAAIADARELALFPPVTGG